MVGRRGRKGGRNWLWLAGSISLAIACGGLADDPTEEAPPSPPAAGGSAAGQPRLASDAAAGGDPAAAEVGGANAIQVPPRPVPPRGQSSGGVAGQELGGAAGLSGAGGCDAQSWYDAFIYCLAGDDPTCSGPGQPYEVGGRLYCRRLLNDPELLEPGPHTRCGSPGEGGGAGVAPYESDPRCIEFAPPDELGNLCHDDWTVLGHCLIDGRCCYEVQREFHGP